MTDMVKAALAMLAKDKRGEARLAARAYLALASEAMRSQREPDEPTYVDTRPVNVHKFKPLDRASGQAVKLTRKRNRAERMLARGEVPPANPWR